jgi:hypothetical protein
VRKRGWAASARQATDLGTVRLACRFAIAGAVASLAALTVGAPAYAQTPSAEDIAAARSLGTDGVRLAAAGNCTAAIPKLSAAEKLFHAPTTLEALGECEIAIGHLVDGTEALNRVVREPLTAASPPPFIAAKHRAEQQLSPALARIGRLRIHIAGAPLDQATVTVDDAPLPAVLIDSDRPTDPGSHRVAATAPGFETQTATVAVPEGGEASVTLELEPSPNAGGAPTATAPSGAQAPPPIPSSPPPAPSPSEAAPSSGRPRMGLAIGSFIVGGAGIVVGSVFGVLALGTKSSLDDACGPTKKACPVSSQGDINNLDTQARISTVGFVVGAAGVTVGIIALATSHRSEPRTSGQSPRVTPWIGWRSAGLEGRF